MIRKINHYFIRANQIINKRLIKISKNPRPSSYPFISGDSFRNLSHHIYEEGRENDFDVNKIKNGDIIFVKSEIINSYFENIHQNIRSKYILITHNGDKNIDQKFEKYIDERIIHWFAQNVDFIHNKITPIPIGLENLHYYHNGITKYFRKFKNKNIKRKNKILFGFTVKHNPKKRIPALSSLLENKNAEQINKVYNSKAYLKELIKYNFVASPEGNGIDCIRTWEAMYLGIVPIVEKSVMTNHFEKMGFPLFVIENWKDIENTAEEELNNKYHNLKNKFESNKLFMDYWIERINIYVPKK